MEMGMRDLGRKRRGFVDGRVGDFASALETVLFFFVLIWGGGR